MTIALPIKPTTVAQYIAAAPAAGRPSLLQLRALLREAAPDAQEVMKWNTPFFVEPRFLFAFSAHRAHLGFTANPAALEPFAEELRPYDVTRAGILKIRYDQPLPEDLIRRIAEGRVRAVGGRTDDRFW